MSSTSKGREAENLVAYYLEKSGHVIKDKNWRTRFCEIDIVSIKDSIVYFTEVKYRSSSKWGDGLMYITDKKLKQMKFSAEYWIATNRWTKDAMLQAASVDDSGKIEISEI